jgi:hypothetical protein
MAICPTCLEYADPDDPATVRTAHADLHAACFAAVAGRRGTGGKGRATGVRPVKLRAPGEPVPGPPPGRKGGLGARKKKQRPRGDYVAYTPELSRYPARMKQGRRKTGS